MNRVEQLREEVARGTYEVDAAAVAEAMIERAERAFEGGYVHNGSYARGTYDRAAAIKRMDRARAARG